jgi:hypothetical protein
MSGLVDLEKREERLSRYAQTPLGLQEEAATIPLEVLRRGPVRLQFTLEKRGCSPSAPVSGAG